MFLTIQITKLRDGLRKMILIKNALHCHEKKEEEQWLDSCLDKLKKLSLNNEVCFIFLILRYLDTS